MQNQSELKLNRLTCNFQWERLIKLAQAKVLYCEAQHVFQQKVF